MGCEVEQCSQSDRDLVSVRFSNSFCQRQKFVENVFFEVFYERSKNGPKSIAADFSR